MGKPSQRNSISVDPSYVEHNSISVDPSYVERNSIYWVPSYVREHSAQLDSSWTVSGPVQISGLDEMASQRNSISL